jgi:acetylornithine deacetylase
LDLLTQIRLTRELVDIDSTTGREGAVGAALARTLQDLGYHVIEQPVSDGRFNVYASFGRPAVVFSTHFDCVPPFFPSREEQGRIYGRGACDAKGIAVAQMAAAERLRASGVTDVGLLFVVGEERGSDGAKVANTLASGSSRFLINGEPTDNRLAWATRGVYRSRLHASGRAAHSSQPELGESAVEKLVDAVVALRAVEWPADPDLGTTYYTVGVIKGGVAPNVIPASAEAEVLFRTVSGHAEVLRLLEAAVTPLVSVEEVHVVPPVRLATLPGFDTAVFNFTTDVPFLDKWGAPLLIGPGSINLAHTADEYVEIAELRRAVDLYVQLAKGLVNGHS